MITNEQRILLELVSGTLFGKSVAVHPDADWGQVFAEAKKQAVSVLAFEKADRDAMPAEVYGEWKKCVKAAFVHNYRVVRGHTIVDAWLREAGIPYVVIKGCASAEYYPDPGKRSMGDVDFLVSKDRLQEAKRLFTEKGMKLEKDAHDAHLVFSDQGILFEMHFDLARIPNNDAGKKVRSYLKDAIDSAERRSIEYGEANMPSAFHHGLIMLLHVGRHLVSEGVGLRHLCDWALFENSYTDVEFRALFEERLKAAGLWNFAALLTAASVKYLKAEPRQWADVADDKITDALMEDILSGGNFGRKDDKRRQGTLFNDNRGEYEFGSKVSIGRFFSKVNRIVGSEWPFFKRCPVFMPVGWLFLLTRRLFRQASGRRSKLELGEAYEEAMTRRELFRRLSLFKGEQQEAPEGEH